MSRKAFLAVCLLLGTVLAVAGAGCGPRAGPDRPPAAQGPPRQPLPEKTAEVAGVKVTVGGGVREGVYHLATFDAGGTFDYAAPDVLFSPDGRTVAFKAFKAGPDGRSQGLWVVALDGSRGRQLDKVGEGENLVLHLLGWTHDNRVLFARQGTQPDGPHKGGRGVSFRLAAPEEGEAREVAWLPVPRGAVNQIQFLPDKGSVFVHVTGALWRVDIPEGRRTLLRGNLPSYDGLFYPRLSPDGNWYVYGLLEPDKSGIYVLATADGGERALAPNGRTWNFHPQFSPDGGHLAYYAAPLKAGRSGRGAYDYDIVPEEDGPAPVAAVVEIATPEGQKVATLTVPGMKITGLRWSADARYVAFAAGKMREEAGETGGTRGMDVMEWHSLWVADLRGGLKKVADLEPTAGYVNVLSVGGDGTRVYYVTGNRDTRTLWLGREGIPPVEVLSASTAAGGSAADVVPVYGEDLLVGWRGPAGDEVFRLRGTQAVPVTADGGDKAVLGMAQNRLVYLRYDRSDVRNRLVILALE